MERVDDDRMMCANVDDGWTVVTKHRGKSEWRIPPFPLISFFQRCCTHVKQSDVRTSVHWLTPDDVSTSRFPLPQKRPSEGSRQFTPRHKADAERDPERLRRTDGSPLYLRWGRGGKYITHEFRFFATLAKRS